MFEPLPALVARIPDGAKIVIPPDYSGVAIAATRALIERGVGNLYVVACPSSGLQADMLIAAGAVATIEAAAITLGEFGVAPAFNRAAREGTITILDSTCPAIHAALQAAEKGLPFTPLRGVIGSDLLTYRNDWKVIQNPFALAPDPIVLLPAIQPDFALFHSAAADRNGNVWIGRRRELMVMAHASRQTLVTVERVLDEDFFDDERRVAGVLPGLYVDAIAVAEKGARPLALDGEDECDSEALARYAAGEPMAAA
jgi:glutaconate CoA-transferase subunit A